MNMDAMSQPAPDSQSGAGSPGLDQRAASLLERAKEADRESKRDQALATVQEVLALNPTSAAAVEFRGRLLHTLGKHGEALADYDRAIALEPHHPEWFTSRGWVYLALKQPDRALINFDAALALAPEDRFALSGRESALFDSGRFEEALAVNGRLLELHDDKIDRLQRISTLRRLGHLPEALAVADALIEERPHYAAALDQRALVYSDLGDFEAALADYDRSLAEWPDDPSTMAERALVLCRLGRADEAYAEADRVLQVQWEEDLGDPVGTYNVACVCALTGRPVQALETLQLALERGFRNAVLLETDSDLTDLRNRPAFYDLLRRLRTTAEN